MPGARGSETRIKTICLPTRWAPPEFERLQAIADHSGCSRAEVLRRLVAHADRKIVASRELVAEIKRVGNNANQIARALNAGSAVSAQQLQGVYHDMLCAVRELLS